MPETFNIARRLAAAAAKFPAKRALVFPAGRDRSGRVAYTHLTFEQLENLACRYAAGFREMGMEQGTRVLLMVRMSLDFTAVAFALFKIGAVPVMIDPGMGIKGFLNCVRQVNPEGFIGIPQAHLVRLLCRKTFNSVRFPVTLGRRLFWGGVELQALPCPPAPVAAVPLAGDELAAILFTSGSTGPAKGVEYTHRIFETQVRILQEEFNLGPENIDLPCFPLFGLFSTGLGCTAVIPDMDPTRPANVDPKKIVEAIRNQGVTYSFGSPALWRTVSRYCADNGIRFPTLKRIFMAGAPVPVDVHRTLLESILPDDADTFTPYGATESLPVSCFSGRQVLADTAAETAKGAGICVGKPVKNATVRIIRVTDEPIARWQESLVLPAGEVGEIAVRGPMVTPAYHRRPEQTALAKIPDGEGAWHRIGDLGYFDAQGRLWMCGRKSHRVRTAAGMMCTVCCEAVFNAHPQVMRSALVGVGADPEDQSPVVVIELEDKRLPRAARNKLAAELLAAAAGNPLTRAVRHCLFHPAFPVDVRHNAKINRETLARFAAAQLR